MTEMAERAKNIAIKYYEGNGHDWEHVLRVLNNCRKIHAIAGGDWEVIEIATYLHDIMRAEEIKGTISDHAVAGAFEAGKILKELGYNKKDEVVECIRTHRFSKTDRPTIMEAMILYDADKLDSIGAVGVARSYQFNNKSSIFGNGNVDLSRRSSNDWSSTHEFQYKLSRVKNRLFTEKGRDMALGRHDFMVKFFLQLKKEIEDESRG